VLFWWQKQWWRKVRCNIVSVGLFKSYISSQPLLQSVLTRVLQGGCGADVFWTDNYWPEIMILAVGDSLHIFIPRLPSLPRCWNRPNLFIWAEAAVKPNKKVSYRKQIASQHSSQKFVTRAGGVVDPEIFFTARRRALARSLLSTAVRPSVHHVRVLYPDVELLYRPGSPIILDFWPRAPVHNSLQQGH